MGPDDHMTTNQTPVNRPIANRGLNDSEILNRFGYHRATEITGPRHNVNREKFAEMCAFLDTVLPEGRAKDKALETLEEASMWANKAIAELAPVVKDY